MAYDFTLCVGTVGTGIWRSTDGGETWEQLSVDLADACPAVRIPRVTSLVVEDAATALAASSQI